MRLLSKTGTPPPMGTLALKNGCRTQITPIFGHLFAFVTLGTVISFERFYNLNISVQNVRLLAYEGVNVQNAKRLMIIKV